MPTNFSLNMDDLLDESDDPITREMSKGLPDPAVPLKTTRAVAGISAERGTTLSVGQALMGVYNFNSASHVTELHEQAYGHLVAGFLSDDDPSRFGVGGKLGEPGANFDLLVPDDIEELSKVYSEKYKVREHTGIKEGWDTIGGPPGSGGEAGGEPGAPPPGTVIVPGDWMNSILQSLGIAATPEVVRFMDAWQRAEGGHTNNNATYNWLNTSETNVPGHTPNAINDHGVQKYDTYEIGIAAMVKTIAIPRYQHVTDQMRSGGSACGMAAALLSPSPVDGKRWGTGQLINTILGC